MTIFSRSAAKIGRIIHQDNESLISQSKIEYLLMVPSCAMIVVFCILRVPLYRLLMEAIVFYSSIPIVIFVSIFSS